MDLLGTYLHLVRASDLRRRPYVSDRFLLLSGALASKLDLPRIAAYCRHRILEHNPWHMVRRWETLQAAWEDSDFLHLLKTSPAAIPAGESRANAGAAGDPYGQGARGLLHR